MISRWEYAVAAHIGTARFCAGWEHVAGYAPTWEDELANHIRSAAAELVVCRTTGAAWTGLTNGARDTSYGEVRTPSKANAINGGLLLRPGDKPHEAYWLVQGNPPALRVAGWAYGRDVMRDVYAREPQPGRPCWIMPPADLKQGKNA